MIGFANEEILFSVLCAVIYGVIFSFLYRLTVIAFRVICHLPALAGEIVGFESIFPAPSIKATVATRREGAFFAFLSTILWFFGLLLLSYRCLDGQIRFYMLVLSSASLYIFNSAFCDILNGFSVLLIDLTVLVISTALRLLILPLKRLFKFNLYKKEK